MPASSRSSPSHPSRSWSHTDLHEHFNVHSFIHPYVIVTRLSDGVKGTVKWEDYLGKYVTFEPMSKRLEKR